MKMVWGPNTGYSSEVASFRNIYLGELCLLGYTIIWDTNLKRVSVISLFSLFSETMQQNHVSLNIWTIFDLRLNIILCLNYVLCLPLYLWNLFLHFQFCYFSGLTISSPTCPAASASSYLVGMKFPFLFTFCGLYFLSHSDLWRPSCFKFSLVRSATSR